MSTYNRKPDNRKIVNIRLNPDLWRRAKVNAAGTEMTLQEWVESSLERKLNVADLVKSVAEWVAANASRESIFLTPDPETTVNAHLLLDRLSELSGISKEQIGGWVAATASGDNVKEQR